jgi:uncharacterized integral membrane protein
MTMQAGEPIEAEVRGKGLRLSGGAVTAGAGIGALATFMAQNTDDVRVAFLVWDFTVAVWLLTLSSAILGAVVWFGLGVLRRHRRRVARRVARRDRSALG